ncbi:unnamed protein product, partial [Oppiella nova]
MSDQDVVKICGVCGDKTNGYYNFNAITCDSCKAFFRRNAFKRDQFKCYFDNNCKIDFKTRKVCRKCRLNKCFSIGMKQTISSPIDSSLNKDNTSSALMCINDNTNTVNSNSNEMVVPCIPPLITDYKNNFNELESNRMTELLSATHVMKTWLTDAQTYLIKHPVIEEACRAWALMCVQEVDKLVKMTKSLVAFNGICDNDRIALIKYGSVE